MRYIFLIAMISGVAGCAWREDKGARNTSPHIEQQLEQYVDSAYYFSTNSFSQSIHYAGKALNLARAHGSEFYEGRAKYELALAYLEHDLYDQALIYAFEALDVFKSIENQEWQIKTIGQLGWVYYDVGQGDHALEFHRQLVDYYAKSGNKAELAMAYNAIGLDYFQVGDVKNAGKNFEKSYALSREVNVPARIAAALNNLGMVYNSLGEFDKAIASLEGAYAISKERNNPLSEAENLNQLGNVYLNMGNMKEAENFLVKAREAITRSRENARKEKLLDNYEFSRQLYARVRDFKKAYEFETQYMALKNEIISMEKSNKLANSLLAYQSQKKEHEIKLLASENKLRALQRDALAGAILLIGVIGFLMYNRQVNIQKKERLLSEAKQALIQKELDRASLEKEALEKERLINETKKELVQKELERASIEKEALRNKLEFKNELMSSFALQISQRNELVRSFVDELKGIPFPASSEVSTRLNKIINHFTQLQNINKEAEEFNLSIEAEHKDFLYKLSQKYPDLTENEKRLCIQVRLNLSIKDIASINNISVKSVEMARYRLRKRLNVDPDKNLSDFLKEI